MTNIEPGSRVIETFDKRDWWIVLWKPVSRPRTTWHQLRFSNPLPPFKVLFFQSPVFQNRSVLFWIRISRDVNKWRSRDGDVGESHERCWFFEKLHVGKFTSRRFAEVNQTEFHLEKDMIKGCWIQDVLEHSRIFYKWFHLVEKMELRYNNSSEFHLVG